MAYRKARPVVSALLTALLLVLVPALTAYAADTYGTDAFDFGDDTPAGARNITVSISNAGVAPFTEYHTFHSAYVGNSTHDEDWFCFDVSAQDVLGNPVYLFEAESLVNANVDPVIEIFGPHATSSFTYTHGHLLLFNQTDPNAVAASTYSEWMSWPWAGAGNQSTQKGTYVQFRPTTAGRYYIRVRPYGDNTGGFYQGWAGQWVLRAKVGAFTRVAGGTRVETAVNISKERFPDGLLDPTNMYANLGSVVLANGYNYPDALSGSCLAGVVQGPILLTAQSSLSPATATELQRLQPATVYVLGGYSAIAQPVEAQILALFPPGSKPTITRLGGADRVATSISVAQTALGLTATTPQTPPGFAFIVNANNFPDALSCSPMAAADTVPVLLTNGTTLDSRVDQLITNLSITDVVIVGGTSAISSGIEAALKSKLGSTRVLRIAGADRYETSKAFAAWACDMPTGSMKTGTPGNGAGLNSARHMTIGVATGQNYPDALAAGPFCGNGWGSSDYAHPLLLTRGDNMSDWIVDLGGTLPPGKTSIYADFWTFGNVGEVHRGYIFGGPSAVSDWVWWQLDSQG